MSRHDHDSHAEAGRAPPATGERSETDAVRAAIGAVRGGDREAFGVLLQLYQRRIFALTLMMVGDPEGAEELTQDAFVRAFTRLDLYDDSRPFYPWLATIAVRLARNWWKHFSRRAGRESAPVDPDRDAASPCGPLDALIADERGRQLWRCVAALPPGQRTAVTLYYREGMTVRGVASALGVTSGTVKTLLYRARRKLRRALDTSASSVQPAKEAT